MKRFISILYLTLISVTAVSAQITLDQCIAMADKNYPLIRKYRIVENLSAISLSDIGKKWLPHITAYGQATAQNEVPAFPETFQHILSQMDADMKGLGKYQYKAGIDLNQNIWDGGSSAAERRIERANLLQSDAALDVKMYEMHERVITIFFAILLQEEKIAQSVSTERLLQANMSRIESLFRNGVVMQSDVDMVKAQLLTVRQNMADMRAMLRGYRDVLSVFIGEDLNDRELELPEEENILNLTSDRPELDLFDSQLRLNEVRMSALDSSLRPRIGLFAQAYYGYPGLNYFESMMNRRLSFNILAGVRIAWSIDPFYTRRNNRSRIAMSSENIRNDREIFLFNSHIQTQSQNAAIEGLREVIKNDRVIVDLRENIRKAAESQLANGIIDTTSLLGKITDESQARLTMQLHRIQLIYSIYQLKYILNR